MTDNQETSHSNESPTEEGDGPPQRAAGINPPQRTGMNPAHKAGKDSGKDPRGAKPPRFPVLPRKRLTRREPGPAFGSSLAAMLQLPPQLA